MLEELKKSVYNMVVCEEVAKMQLYSLKINKDTERLSKAILDKHYIRKHGENSYYGQKG